jgi:hypothetical protein
MHPVSLGAVGKMQKSEGEGMGSESCSEHAPVWGQFWCRGVAGQADLESLKTAESPSTVAASRE